MWGTASANRFDACSGQNRINSILHAFCNACTPFHSTPLLQNALRMHTGQQQTANTTALPQEQGESLCKMTCDALDVEAAFQQRAVHSDLLAPCTCQSHPGPTEGSPTETIYCAVSRTTTNSVPVPVRGVTASSAPRRTLQTRSQTSAGIHAHAAMSPLRKMPCDGHKP